jgi:hypothetical protein
MASWRDVRRLALALPATNEQTSYGNASWAVNKKSFAWERPLGKADIAALGAAAPKGAILGIRTESLEMKEALLASDPSVFFTTPHFNGYPAVLIRLGKITPARLQRVLVDAWLVRAPKRLATEFLQSSARR